MDYNSPLMLNDNPPSNAHRPWQFDPINVPTTAKSHAIKEAEWRTQQFWTHSHAPNSETMNRQSSKAGLRPIAAVASPILFDQRPQSITHPTIPLYSMIRERVPRTCPNQKRAIPRDCAGLASIRNAAKVNACLSGRCLASRTNKRTSCAIGKSKMAIASKSNAAFELRRTAATRASMPVSGTAAPQKSAPRIRLV